MKMLVAGLVLTALCTLTSARPSMAVVETCLHAASTSPEIHYIPINAGAFEIVEDIETKTTATILHVGKDSVGTWERTRPATFGLVFNGIETPLAQITRLGKSNAPTEFSPYEAIWGLAQDGKTSYICATFNFDGLGKSGSFQNVRGVYLIERRRHSQAPFFTIGNITTNK